MSNNFETPVSQLTRFLEEKNSDELLIMIEQHHPAKLGRLIESLPNKYRKDFWRLIPVKDKGEVLLAIHRELRVFLIKLTDESDLIKSLSNLQMDELADIDADLPLPVVTAMVEAMDSQRKKRYETVKSFPDNTAGGLMDIDFTAVRKDVSLKAVYRYLCQLRTSAGMLPEHLDHLVALAVLMPVVASMGGITGSQTLTVVCYPWDRTRPGEWRKYCFTHHSRIEGLCY